MSEKSKLFNIIFAEDNPADADLVRLALSEHGVDCELHVIRDGAEVIQRMSELDAAPESRTLDLLILDMHLPKENGETVLKSLRSTAHYGKTPVVLMSCKNESLIASQAEGFPELIFFEKPSSLDEFMRLGALVGSILSLDKKPVSQTRAYNNRRAGFA